MKYYFVILIFFLSLTTNSQNLVPNGDFEDHLPIKCLSCYYHSEPFSKLLKGAWQDLNTNPILCDCNYKQNEDEKKYRRCRLDKVKPKSGKSMMEMGYLSNCTDFNHITKGCSAYLGTTLKEPLEVGKVYEISFWVYISEEEGIDPGYPNNIGIGLFPKRIRNPNDVMIEDPAFLLDTFVYNKWFLSKRYIRPLCNLRYLVIGVFRTEQWPTIHTYSNFSPYYIDNIVVKEYTEKEKSGIKVSNYCRNHNSKNSQLTLEIEGVDCYFASNSPLLTEKGHMALDSFANRIKSHPQIAFSITGNTDSIGENHYELSKARVESVLTYLKNKHKIPNFRFVKIYAGDSQPKASNSTEKGRKLNRHVAIRQSDSDLAHVFYRNMIINIEKGEINKAYKILAAWFHFAKEDRKLLVLFDPRLKPLRDQKKKWELIFKRVKKSYNRYKKPELSFSLDSLWAEDQKYRTLEYYIENLNVYLDGIDEKENKKWGISFDIEEDSIPAHDHKLLLTLLNQIKKDDMPKISDFGERPAKGAFLILLHSNDKHILQKYLPIIKNNCLEGEAEWIWYALMFDRLEVLNDRPQKYGTQYHISADGKSERYPLKNKQLVNKWREEIGLSPIEVD